MAIEIERKFLVRGEQWRALGQKVFYRQGYLPSANLTTMRVRIAGEQGFLTIKGQNTGASRLEFEYPIPLTDAQMLLDKLCETSQITKYRYRIPLQNLVWEVDEFLGENQGLVIAEVELQDENQVITLPEWIGTEVTGESRYYNVNLMRHPYCQWESS